MNLENFDQKSTIIINAAFNYAAENNYAYLTPVNILEVMLKTNEAVKLTMEYFSINIDTLYLDSQNYSKKSNKKKDNEDTLIGHSEQGL